MEPSIYVINRRDDAARLSQFATAADGFGAAFQRIPAFDGHDPLAPFFLYQHLLGDTFWGEPDIKPGAFACYVSHTAAWRKFLASDAELALICEDDAVFTRDPAEIFAECAELEFDVLLANARMVDWRRAADLENGDATDVADVLAAMAASSQRPGDGIAAAPGADCYVVSRAGAETLLANLKADKVIAGVDWMILRRSADIKAKDWPEWAFLSGATGPANLRTLIAATPVAAQSDGPSVISHSATTPIDALKTQRAIASAAEAGLNRAPKGDIADPVFAAFADGEFYEAPALEMMRRWMPEGRAFVDIGAHVGGHTLFMLRHGGAAKAIPVEFNPPTHKLLAEMVLLNDLGDRVDLDLLGLAMTEERGKREAVGSRKNLSNVRLKEGFIETIKTRPGDQMLREFEVGMIKLDVNGAERETLKGLKKTLKRQRPVLALDLTRRRSEKALPLLGRLGYEERERAVWTDAEGERRVAIFTSDGPVRRAAADAA